METSRRVFLTVGLELGLELGETGSGARWEGGEGERLTNSKMFEEERDMVLLVWSLCECVCG